MRKSEDIIREIEEHNESIAELTRELKLLLVQETNVKQKKEKSK